MFQNTLKIIINIKHILKFSLLISPFSFFAQENALIEQEMWKNEPFGEYQMNSELIERRNGNEKHFDIGDGKTQMFASNHPLNYFKNGKWNTIFSGIELNTSEPNQFYKYVNLHNTFSSYYPENIASGIQTSFHNGIELKEMNNLQMYVSNEDFTNISNLKRVNDATAKTYKNTIIYKNSFDGNVDILFTQSAGKRKLDYILNHADFLPEASEENKYLVFEEDIILPEGYSVRIIDGNLEIRNQKGELIASYLKPYINDSKKNENPEIHESLTSSSEMNQVDLSSKNIPKPNSQELISFGIEQKGKILKIKTKILLSWLKNKDRVFPIFVDPTLSNSTTYSSYTYGGGAIYINTSGAPANSSITNVYAYTTIGNIYYGYYYYSNWYGYYYYSNNYCSTASGSQNYYKLRDNLNSYTGRYCSSLNTSQYNCKNPNNNWACYRYSDYWSYPYGGPYTYAYNFYCYVSVTYVTLNTPTIDTTPITSCIGYDPAAISLTNSPGGSGTLSYQWYLNGAVITGETSTSYNPPATTNAGTYSYTLRVTDGCGKTALSAAKTITINGYGQTTGLATSDYIWKGSVNTDWTNVNNWSTYNGSGFYTAVSAPTTANNVIIPLNGTCVSNQPNIAGNTANSKNTTIETGASLTMGTGTLNVTGNWLKNGTLNSGTGNVNFTGTTAQTLGGTGTSTFYNCKVSNTSTGLTLNSPVSVTNSLNMTTGNVTTTNTNILTLGVSSPASLSWTAGTVVGPMKRWFATSTNSGDASGLFPVGNNPSSVLNRWALIEYSTAPTTAGYLTVQFIGSNPSLSSVGQNGLPLTEVDQMNDIATDGYWQIDPTGLNGGTYAISLRANSFGNTEVFLSGRILKSPDPHTIWTLAGTNVATSGSASDFTLKRTGISGFSFFAVGFQGFVPLPIELMSFQANCISDNEIKIDWKTSSEYNSDYYLLEKSMDGYEFNELAILNASGNSTEIKTYSFIDRISTFQSNYYRLIQFDTDGKSELFNITETNCNNSQEEILVYPNPTNGDLFLKMNNLSFNGYGKAMLYSLNGKLLSTTNILIENKQNTFRIANEGYTPGIYFLKVQSNHGEIKTIKVIIE
jgi:hypothetical protein